MTSTRLHAYGKVGPNAVLQVSAALSARFGDDFTHSVFAGAHVARPGGTEYNHMIEESIVSRLHQAVRAALPPGDAHTVLRDAGVRTAHYIVANRLPRPARLLLERLPSRLAAVLLVHSIGQHAWTFAGSGAFASRGAKPVTLDIVRCPLCHSGPQSRPQCGYYEGVFEGLFRILINPAAQAAETLCQAMGADRCRFEVSW